MYAVVFRFALWGNRYLWNLGASDSTFKHKQTKNLIT